MQVLHQTMPADSQSILEQLALVEHERQQRAADLSLAASVLRLKHYQQLRFERSYADLLADERYAPAAQFFLEELYGPRDFSKRDAQFTRVVPALVRLFPQEVVDTVATLARLHALSEAFDSAMARHLRGGAVDRPAYALAWRQVGRVEDREQQVELILDIGRSLDRLTRKPLLRRGLQLMRGPARSAGLSALQAFLERGFDAFRTMRGADQFLATIAARERALAAALFANTYSVAPADLP